MMGCLGCATQAACTFNEIEAVAVAEGDHAEEAVLGDGALRAVVEGNLSLSTNLNFRCASRERVVMAT